MKEVKERGGMTENEILDVVETRVAKLERQILGKRDVPQNYAPISETLAKTNSHLQSAVSGRDKITSVMKRMIELEKYLDPSQNAVGAGEINAMCETILLAEPVIRNNHFLLNQINELSTVLNSEHTKNVPALYRRLEQLTLVSLNLKDNSDKLCNSFRNYIEEYNNIILEISSELLRFDNIITQCEIEAQPKIADE